LTQAQKATDLKPVCIYKKIAVMWSIIYILWYCNYRRKLL